MTPFDSTYLDAISMVIVEPKHAGNIGSICRACKNMGIARIILVNPQVDYLNDDDTYKLGWASRDWIQAIQVVPTLQDALADHKLCIATTMRARTTHPPIEEARAMVQKSIPIAASGQRVAFVFGREDNGLTAEELSLCHFISTIPTSGVRPAINLSQAVMIYAYECFLAMAERPPLYEWNLATQKSIQVMYKALEETIPLLPINTRKGAAGFVDLFRRVFNRSQLEERDVRLFLKLFSLIRRK